MSMPPKLKRVTLTNQEKLNAWLSQNTGQNQSVMLVTHTQATPQKHISTEQVQAALNAHGWSANRRYTLSKHLLGHVITPPKH